MAIDYDRGPNDLEETIDRLEKQKKYYKSNLRKQIELKKLWLCMLKLKD